MRIGTTSMVYWNWDIAQFIKKTGEIGFDTIEIWVRQFKRQEKVTPKKLNRLLKEAGLTPTVHVPIRDLNIASINKGIRKESVAQMIETINFCAEIEGELVVMHPGRLSGRMEDPEEQWKYQLESFEIMMREAEKKSVVIAVENMEYSRKDELVVTAQDIKRLQNMLKGFYLPVTLDTTHMESTERILDTIEMLKGDIRHIHLSDYDNKYHRPLGEGILDFETIFKKLKEVQFKGIISLEVMIFQPDQSTNKLEAERDKVLKLIGT